MRVLVVDTEILIAVEAAQILEDALGCTATATTWMNVANHGGALRFDIVIADCDVHGESLGLLDLMMATRGAATIFMTTANGAAMAATGSVLLNKPFLPAALLDAVAKARNP